jgi:expansin (peptidoglycan-binding protein)
MSAATDSDTNAAADTKAVQTDSGTDANATQTDSGTDTNTAQTDSGTDTNTAQTDSGTDTNTAQTVSDTDTNTAQTDSGTDTNTAQTVSDTDTNTAQTDSGTDTSTAQTDSDTDTNTAQTDSGTDTKAAQTDSDTDTSATQTDSDTDTSATQTDSDTDTTSDAADTAQTQDSNGNVSDSEIHYGEATYYGATGEGALGFDATDDRMITAMNTIDLYGLDAAGAYVKVTGPEGTITVKVVDELPEQREGALDLSQEAFAMIADPIDGIVPIQWQFVDGDVEGPIQYKFKEGSNEYWTAIQIRNHRTRIAKVEVQNEDGSWETLNRETYNYFTSSDGGMGAGPYNIRVTDVNGSVIEDTNVPFSPGSVVDGESQFPPTETT